MRPVKSMLALAFLSAVLPLAGAAAPAGLHPVVLIDPSTEKGEAYSLVLGAWENGKWLSAKKLTGKFPATARWRVQALSGPAVTLTSMKTMITGEQPCEETGYLVLPASAPFPKFRLATSPALNARPRPVVELPVGLAAYQNLVKAELVKRGLNTAKVNITALVRADLDGNGTQEVIIAASAFKQGTSWISHFPPPHAGAGDYSLLLLRWVKNGQAQTTVLGESFFTRDEKPDGEDWQMPTQYGLAGIADLNGDGRMELITTDAYYEGSGAAVLEWTPAGGIKERLSEGCGV